MSTIGITQNGVLQSESYTKNHWLCNALIGYVVECWWNSSLTTAKVLQWWLPSVHDMTSSTAAGACGSAGACTFAGACGSAGTCTFAGTEIGISASIVYCAVGLINVVWVCITKAIFLIFHFVIICKFSFNCNERRYGVWLYGCITFIKPFRDLFFKVCNLWEESQVNSIWTSIILKVYGWSSTLIRQSTVTIGSEDIFGNIFPNRCRGITVLPSLCNS